MNIFAKFDENPAITLQVIKKTKRYGRTHARTDGRTDGRTDNVKTVYPTTNKVCGGYKNGFEPYFPYHTIFSLITGFHLRRHFGYIELLNDARVASLGFFKDNVYTTRINKEKKFKINRLRAKKGPAPPPPREFCRHILS